MPLLLSAVVILTILFPSTHHPCNGAINDQQQQGQQESALLQERDEERQQSHPLIVDGEHLHLLQQQILLMLDIDQPLSLTPTTNTSFSPPNSTSRIEEVLASRMMSALYKRWAEKGRFNKRFSYLDVEVQENITLPRYLDSVSSASSFLPERITPPLQQMDNPYYELEFNLKAPTKGLSLIHADVYILLEGEEGQLMVREEGDDEVVAVERGNGSMVGLTAPFRIDNHTLLLLNMTRWLAMTPTSTPNTTTQILRLKMDSGISQPPEGLRSFGIAFYGRANNAGEQRRGRRAVQQEDHDDEEEDEWEEEPSPPLDDVPGMATSVASKGRCRRHSLYIGFQELGWDGWVIAPQGFQSGYCDGECSFPLDASLSPTNHAIVQTLVHLLDKERASTSQCAPTALKAQSILFFDHQHNVVMRRYADMRVTECGCR